MIGRREFITLLGGGGAATIRAGIGWAQVGKLATIGFLDWLGRRLATVDRCV